MTRTTIGFALLIALLPPAGDAEAGGPSAEPPTASDPLRFEVRFNPRPDDADDQRRLEGRLLVAIGRPDQGEPRLRVGRTGMNQEPLLGVDVHNFNPGATAVLDRNSAIFPIDRLDRMPPGTYSAQALLHTNRDLNHPNAPGDLFGPPRTFQVDREGGGTVPLELDRAVPDEAIPPDSGLVRYVKLQSKLLSAFHGRPIHLRAGVVLPRDYDREPGRRYPLRVHIGGYGSRFTQVGAMTAPDSEFGRAWNADDAPRTVLLHLDGAGPFGDPYQVNSANNGPYGDAVVTELIPFVESRWRCIGDGSARGLDGGSTGGWVALALQIFHPDFFNGAWASCPDSVDFRNFELVDVYEDDDAYVNAHGFERPAARDRSGEVRYTMRHELALENVLGRGNSWTASGGQWGAWNAVYSPRADDGRPAPLWDPKTGRIDHRIADHWRRYDLRRILEADWPTLGPRLRGKLHIDVGDADDYFLNNAVHRLDAFLSRAEPKFEGTIRYGPGEGHCWSGSTELELMRRMAERIDSGVH